jgi:hypothetical protein
MPFSNDCSAFTLCFCCCGTEQVLAVDSQKSTMRVGAGMTVGELLNAATAAGGRHECAGGETHCLKLCGRPAVSI